MLRDERTGNQTQERGCWPSHAVGIHKATWRRLWAEVAVLLRLTAGKAADAENINLQPAKSCSGALAKVFSQTLSLISVILIKDLFSSIPLGASTLNTFSGA